MSDMALEKPLRISSGLTCAVLCIEKFLITMLMGAADTWILLGCGRACKRRILWTSFCK
jgi:hypothetical protein